MKRLINIILDTPLCIYLFFIAFRFFLFKHFFQCCLFTYKHAQVRLLLLSSSSTMHDVVHKCFSLCKFCIFNSCCMSFELKQWQRDIINFGYIVLHCRAKRREKKEQRLQNLWWLGEHNEWIFSAIKVQKRRIVCLCGVKSKFIYCHELK